MTRTAIKRPAVRCDACDAVCCRLTVMLQADDRVPAELSTISDTGLHVMKRAADGWCVALDRNEMRCSIYSVRPDTCRRFHMGGGYCRAIRAEYAERARPTPSPSTLI
jgi:Fe-S-cluster containining protein